MDEEETLINLSRRSYRTLNIASALKSHLSEETYDLLKLAGEAGDECGYSVYMVGGFVRDFLLGLKNLDMDLVVEGDGIDFARALSDRLGGKVLPHDKFQTAVVTLPDGFRVDVATARVEFYEYPAALPTVEVSSIRHDLYRRDFTINAMAVRLNAGSFGDLVDFYGGKKDLDEGLIRALHNFSFIEDPTRIFRAIRYESRYNFRIEEGTAHLIRSAVELELIDKLSGKRIANELVDILSEEGPIKAVGRMEELGVISLVRRDVKLGGDAYRLLERVLDAADWFTATFPDEPFQRWVGLFMGIFCRELNSGQLDELCQRLMLTREVRESVVAGAVDRVGFLSSLGDKPASVVYRLLKPIGAEAVVFYLAMAEDDGAGRRIKDFLLSLRWTSTHIKGDDLIAEGYPVGPAINNLLNIVLDARLDGKITTKDEELAYARDNFNRLYK